MILFRWLVLVCVVLRLTWSPSSSPVFPSSPLRTLRTFADDNDSSVPPVLSRFPVPHTEEWWIIVGDEQQDKLMGIKRITIPRKGSVKKKIKIALPEEGEGALALKMYVISDSYRGCDEERDVQIIM